MFKRFGCIYKITNLVNGKSYIGQTVRKTKYRWNEHKNYRLSRHLGNAMDHYGIANFQFEEIYTSFDLDDLNTKEVYFINHFNTMSNGYNLTSGGNNELPSNDTKEKISRSLKGRKQTKEHIEKVRLARVGQKLTDQARINQLNSRKRKKIICIQTLIIYNSISEAAKLLDINKGNLSNVLNGRRKTLSGLSFRYVS